LHGDEQKVTFDEALYQLVHEMGYTWGDVLKESLPRTLYSLEKLQEEAKRKKDERDEIEKKTKKTG